MPGSQGAAGERNDVWDLENPRSPISLGAMEWINIPMPGGGWARSGYTQVFRDPPFQGHVPLPRGGQQALRHSYSWEGDPRTSAPTSAPTRRGRPPGWGWDRGCGRGRGRSGLTRSCRRRRRSSSPASRPRCPLGSSPRPCRRSTAPPPALPPSFPSNLRLESRNRVAAARKEGDFPGPRRQRTSAIPQPRMQRSEITSLCSPRIQGSAPPPTADREVRDSGRLFPQD